VSNRFGNQTRMDMMQIKWILLEAKINRISNNVENNTYVNRRAANNKYNKERVELETISAVTNKTPKMTEKNKHKTPTRCMY